MDLFDVVRNTLVGLTLGHAVDRIPIPEQPTQAELAEVENSRDASLYFDPTPEPEFSPVVALDQEPTPAAFTRSQRAQGNWHKIADLPMEPGVYEAHVSHSRQICHLVVYPANKAESRMEYGLHCGVDSTPKTEK